MEKIGLYFLHIFIILSCSGYADHLTDYIPEENDSLNIYVPEVVEEDEEEVRQLVRNKDSIPVIRFVDSTAIGTSGRYKFVIEKIAETYHYEFWLYKKVGKKWKEIQHREDRTEETYMFDPAIKDYNGDGKGDLSFHYLSAARGGNEIRIVYLFDPKKEELYWLKNSEKIPNLVYQKDIKMMNGWALHSGSTTLFLEIQGDSLVEKASCEWHDSTIYVDINQNGKWIEKEIDTTYKDPYMLRFTNYNPIELATTEHFEGL